MSQAPLDLTSRAPDSFAWDAENHMTSATVSSTTTTFAYNGNGLRDSLTTGGNTTTFTWDPSTGLRAGSAAGIPQVLDDGAFKYVYGLGRIAEVSGSNTYYYLTDGLGSVMALCNSSGTVLNSYEYDVFGAVRSSTGSTANAFTFTGEQTDASTGLEYLRARYYDSASGRFISSDPAGGGYPYGANNPARMFDPSGLYPICFAEGSPDGEGCYDSTEVNLPAEPPLACSGAGGTGHCVYPDGSVYLAGGAENVYEGEAEFWIPAEDRNGTNSELPDVPSSGGEYCQWLELGGVAGPPGSDCPWGNWLGTWPPQVDCYVNSAGPCAQLASNLNSMCFWEPTGCSGLPILPPINVPPGCALPTGFGQCVPIGLQPD